MNFLRKEVEQHLSQFLDLYDFVFALEGREQDSTFVAYQGPTLLLAFYWSIDDGESVRVGRLGADDLTSMLRRCSSIPHYFQRFNERYLAALKSHEYPSKPTDAEFYHFMDLSLRDFMSLVESGRIMLADPP